jgi:hypothetical protein
VQSDALKVGLDYLADLGAARGAADGEHGRPGVRAGEGAGTPEIGAAQRVDVPLVWVR